MYIVYASLYLFYLFLNTLLKNYIRLRVAIFILLPYTYLSTTDHNFDLLRDNFFLEYLYTRGHRCIKNI